MTPLARRIYNRVAALPRNPTRDLTVQEWIDMLCFEMTDVLPLMRETIKTLEAMANEDLAMGHGSLLVMPHDNMWIEYRLPPHKLAPLPDRAGIALSVCENPDEIAVTGISESSLDAYQSGESRNIAVFKASIRLLPDDMFRVEVCKKHNYDEDLCTETAGVLAFYAVAALLILNAPYGIKHSAPPVHKTHAREALKQGFKLKPHRIITLDKTRPPPPEHAADGTPRTGPAFHKAFHFVRQHLRHYQERPNRPASRTLVKAHWRGDPRLGVCPMPDYRIRP